MITEGGGGGWSGLKVIQKIVCFSFPSADDQTGSHACQASVLPPSYSPTPSHIREMQFPAPTVGHGTRDCLQSGVGVGSCSCSDFFPASQLPFPEVWFIPWAYPQGMPTCLTHELFLVVQGTIFLTGLDGHINFFPFLQQKCMFRDSSALWKVSSPQPQHGLLRLDYQPRQMVWLLNGMPSTPHALFLSLFSCFFPCFLPSRSFCVRTRKGFRDQKAQSLCPEEDTESCDPLKGKQVCGRTHTGSPSEESRASFCVFTVGFQPSCSP